MKPALTPADCFSLKAAMRALTQRCGGGVNAARVSGLSEAQISRLGSPAETDLPNVATVLLLERDIGEPVVSRALIEAVGAADGAPQPLALGDLSHLLRETSDAARSLAEALDDDRITETEARALERKFRACEYLLKTFRRRLPASRKRAS